MSHKPQLFSGARGLITYGPKGNERILGIATDISVNVRDNLRPSYVVGSMNPISIEPLSIDVDCSIGRLIPVNTPAGTDQSALIKGATARDLELEQSINAILKSDSIDIVIKDKNTDQVIATVREARFAGRSSSITSGDISQERLNFVGIFVSEANQNVAEATGYVTYE